MHDKGILKRDNTSVKHVYSPAQKEKKIKTQLLDRVIDTMFNGSRSSLVLQLLGNKKTSKKELQEIKEFLKKLEAENQKK